MVNIPAKHLHDSTHIVSMLMLISEPHTGRYSLFYMTLKKSFIRIQIILSGTFLVIHRPTNALADVLAQAFPNGIEVSLILA
ncbi:hypothetical protein DVA76_18315 [Acinetobacter baumannii]|nr:hypothetical protein DVA76_18315 [Acinetobacter baumannii]